MCSSEAQVLLDRQTMPRWSIVWKWDFCYGQLALMKPGALEQMGAVGGDEVLHPVFDSGATEARCCDHQKLS